VGEDIAGDKELLAARMRASMPSCKACKVEKSLLRTRKL
jgi:hypothetical protein